MTRSIEKTAVALACSLAACSSLLGETAPVIAVAPHFWDQIPPSPSTTMPVTIKDDYWHGQYQRVNQEVARADRTELVFFGDSITWNWSLGAGTGRDVWEKEYSRYHPLNMGNSGDITPVMLYRVTHGNLDFTAGQQPKVAVLLCGTNNFVVTQSAGGEVRWDLGAACPPRDVAAGARAIAQVFRRRLPQTRVIMMGILPVANQVKWPKCQQANAINAALACNRDEVVCLDLRDRFLLPDGSINPRLFTDGTHLTPDGYRVWAAGIDPLVSQMMEAAPLDPVKIMLIGDSITEGINSSGSYRRYLDGMLRRKGHLIDFVGSRRKHNDNQTEPDSYEYDVDHEGHWGRNSAWLAESMPALLGGVAPDVAVIHLGTVDIMAGTPAAEPLTDGIIGNINKVVGSLRAKNATVKIVLATIIPVPGKAAEVRLLNEKISSYAAAHATPRSPVVVADQHAGFNIAEDLAGGSTLPNPTGAEKMAGVFADAVNKLISDTATGKDGAYTKHVQACVDLLMAHGTDTYGKIQAPIPVSILDADTRNCPETPDKLDEFFRVNRRDRRSPGGSNLLTDQPTLKAMHALSEITGNADYASFADRYASYVMKNLVDEQGFFWWGWHRHYDVFTDSRKGHNPNRAKWGEDVFPHEIHAINSIAWDRLWAVDKGAVTKEIEAIWNWHVIDKKSGEINRHGDGNKGCDFTMSGGAFIEAFAFMDSQTKDPQWLDRAKRVADYYWQRRDPETNLLPERPNAGKSRFDGGSFVTANTGLYCHSLLKAYEMTGEKSFRDHAVAYLQAYAKFGYDEKSGKFWGALKMDGTPIPGPRVKGGYAQYEPRGHLDLWEPYVAGYQYAIYTAQAYAYAYQLTGEPVFLTTAERFAAWIRKTPPGTPEAANTWYDDYSKGPGRKGTYAGKYGRTISFLLHLYVVTGERRHLDDARAFADTAIEKLYYKGLFRGHPAKPYYEAIDGVGYLLYALLELDQVLEDPKATVNSKAILTGKAKRKMALDNW